MASEVLGAEQARYGFFCMSRRLKLFVAGALASASALGGASDGNPLDAERWRTRPLVIVVPAANAPLLTQIESALRDKAIHAGFVEREMVLYKVVGGQGIRDGQALSQAQTSRLLAAVGATSSSVAAAYLIGKDGGVKLTKLGELSMTDLFATIDQMPMRRQ